MSAKGIHSHRFKQNPEERRFAEAWAAEQRNNSHLLKYLMGDGLRMGVVSERDEVVAATVMQWLGSPVGQCFLRDLGYMKKEPSE